MLRVLHHKQSDAPVLSVLDQPHGQLETQSVTMAASSHGGCNPPGEILSCSFILYILMTTTTQDCEKGRGSPSSCHPQGDAGTGTQAPCAGKRLFQQISFPLWSKQSNKVPSPTSSLALISWKKKACSFPSPSYPGRSGGCRDEPSSPRSTRPQLLEALLAIS